MASQVDVKEISDDASVSSKPRFDKRDWDTIAESVTQELTDRRNDDDRVCKEKQWKDIDRQIAMEPDRAFKTLSNGKVDTEKAWMAEVELPLQAQAFEILNSDADRFIFPDTGCWYRAHAECTDDYFERVNFQSIILGDQTEVPSHINQDNADKLVQGFLEHLMRQNDFRTRIKRINGESFKYGIGVGRARMETKNVFIDEARGVRKQTQRIPVLVPTSIKNTYLDPQKPSTHSSHVLGPAHISVDNMRYENLVLAATKGSNDPDDPDGGWMPANLKKLVKDKNGFVQLIEMEGDIVVPRKTTRSIVIPGAVVTVAVGGVENGKSTRVVIRFRFRKSQFSSYLQFPYQYEGADGAYPTSPLMKGRTLQIFASSAANRTLDSAALKISPPVGYDQADPHFSQKGGPVIHPYAKWGTVDPNAVKMHVEAGGDPSTMLAMMNAGTQFYAELTGVLPGRIGAQTVSHTTAFAKDAELQRGAVRTIAYVNQIGNGPMLRWLEMAYEMGRNSMNGPTSFYIYDYGGFVEIDKKMLPDRAIFEWLGAGGAQDRYQKQQVMANGLMLAMKIDQLRVQLGQPPRIDSAKAIDAVLRESGWIDLDAITNQQSEMPSAAGGPGPAVAALQNLTMQPPQ